MEENKDNSKITRKRFLNVCGSLVAAGGIIGVSGTLVHKMVSLPEQSGSKLSPTWKPTAWATQRAVLPSMGRFATSRFMPT